MVNHPVGKEYLNNWLHDYIVYTTPPAEPTIAPRVVCITFDRMLYDTFPLEHTNKMRILAKDPDAAIAFYSRLCDIQAKSRHLQ